MTSYLCLNRALKLMATKLVTGPRSVSSSINPLITCSASRAAALLSMGPPAV